MTAISVKEIKEAWQYAEMAYRSQKDLIISFPDSLSVIDSRVHGIGDACYVLKIGYRAVVMFPGSNDPVDWALNLNFRESQGLHNGFLDGIEDIGDDIIKTIRDINPKQLLITGHSRGGAMANMFLKCYAYKLYGINIDCITFAEPRIATKEFYETIFPKQHPSVRYLRVHTTTDPVPHLPPEKFGFVHHGDSMEIGEKLTKWLRVKLWWSKIRHGDVAPLIVGGHLASTYRNEIDRLR